jgi:hypothetical protein
VTPVSHLPRRHGGRPVPGCTADASTDSHPAGEHVRNVAADADQLAAAWRLWTQTRQPAALREVRTLLAGIVLAACTAAYLTDPEGLAGPPAPPAA